jgi:hypothetical protein
MGLNFTKLRQVMCTIDPGNSSNFAQWGKLVKTWVTGKNQFGDGKDYSIPASKDGLQPAGAMTKQQFEQMLQNAKVEMTIPDKVKRFVFVQDDDSTVIVRLPSKEVLQNIKGQLDAIAASGDAPYPLPAFYTTNWPPTSVPIALDADGLTRMHCQRIGEYTINTCG